MYIYLLYEFIKLTCWNLINEHVVGTRIIIVFKIVNIQF